MVSDYLLPIAIIALLIVINGLFVAAEFAVVAAPYSRIAQLAAEGSAAAARVLPWLKDPEKRNRYIGAAQVGITIASLGLGMYGEETVVAWLLPPLEHYLGLSEAALHTVAVIIGVGILTYLHVVVGEMIPKSLAIQSAEATLLGLARFMAVVQKLFSPLILSLNAAANLITRLMGIPPAGEKDRLFSSEELEYIVEEAVLEGLLDPSERIYVENIFDLSERTVGQVMTPRNRIVGIEHTARPEEVIAFICANRYSRYPVYEEDLDHVLGVVHVKSVARELANGGREFDITALMKEPLIAPEMTRVSEMLRLFRQKKEYLAIVIDEYGGVAGLVTMEDLMEEVVGEIQDEYDQETPPIREIDDHLLEVRGDVLLDELNQHYDLRLYSRDADTVGGLVMALLGRVPQVGDEVELQGVRLSVQSVDGMAVGAVRVHLPLREETQSDA
ncbi:MAG: HlyC/CorC family transporter [Chloroflexi bacterium]|nr:HlyC/CorC family transporter [Chloroflexota bacterium]